MSPRLPNTPPYIYGKFFFNIVCSASKLRRACFSNNANIIINSEGCKAVAAGMNPMDLKRGAQLAVDEVCQKSLKITEMTACL